MLLTLFLLLEVLIMYKVTNKHLNTCPTSNSYRFDDWECRLDVMTFIGKTLNLNIVDFEQINNSEKKTVRIVLSSSTPILITPKTFANLDKIEELDLDIPNLIIKKDSFHHFKALKRLTIISNNNVLITNGSFNYDLFKGLHELSSLRIVSYNSPLSFPKSPTLNIFHSLKYLHELTIIGPEIIIPRGSNLFERAEKLVSLNIYGALITGINKHLFDNLANLKSLEIHDKTKVLRTVEDGCFDSLRNLEALVVKVKLTHIPKQWFSYNLKLNGITLRTLVNHIDEDLFVNNKFIVYLDLSQNFMYNIPDKLFSENKELRILNLSENFITNINDEAFKGLTNLTLLYLNDNNIEEVGNNALSTLKSVELIKLNGNKLYSVGGDDGLGFLKSVLKLSKSKTIDLKENKGIMCVPEWIKQKRQKNDVKLRFDEGIGTCSAV
eukprot:GAHX01002149.1.p1 GENE.GAHX01002149.1~~GAHX01002149.1.p1  ORF type:complete len:438 (-),score=78.61 GAHX01002149.1:28-1341(-)